MAWRERQGYAGGERSVNSQIVEDTFAAFGAYVMGRRTVDGGEILTLRARLAAIPARPQRLLTTGWVRCAGY